jgi:TP901 family phage tail tape measure protein
VSISARDLVFVLKARDEASDVFSGVSRDLLKIGRSAELASKRAEAASLRQKAADTSAAAQMVANADRKSAADLRNIATILEQQGATKQQTDALRNQARAYEQHAATVKMVASDEAKALHAEARAIDLEVNRLEESIRAHQRRIQTLKDASSAVALVGVAMIGVGAVSLMAMFGMVKDAEAYQKQVALTQTQVDGFSASLQQLSDMGKDVAKNIAVPFEQIQPALYNIFSSTDANLQQAGVMLKAFAKEAVAGNVSIDAASAGTMGIMNAFKIPLDDVNKVLDVQFQLVRKGVGTFDQFNSVMGRISPSAVRAGQDLNTTAAILAFLTRNGQSAAMAATSGARALDAFSNPKAVANLEAMGIKMKDMKGNFLPLVDILQQLSDKMKSMTDPQRAAAISDIFKGAGGTSQARRFIDVVVRPDQLAAFKSLLGSMKDSTGQFESAYQKMADTVAAKSQLLNNNWKVLRETVGEYLAPALLKLLDYGNRIVSWFNNLSPHMQKVITYAFTLGAFIMILVGAFFGLLAILGAAAAAIASLDIGIGEAFIAVMAIIGGLIAFGYAMYWAFTHSKPLQDIAKGIAKWFLHLWKDILIPFAQEVKAKFDKDLVPAFHALWDEVNNRVIPAVKEFLVQIEKKLGPAIHQALNDLKEIVDWGFKAVSFAIYYFLIPALELAVTYYHHHKEEVDKLIGILIWLMKWILILAGAGVIGALVVAFAILIGFIGAVAIIVMGTLYVWHVLVGMFNVVKSAVEAVWHAIEIFIEIIKRASKQALQDLQGMAAGIISSFANLPSELYNIGKNMILGLAQGMQAQLGGLKNFLGNITNSILQWKGPPAKDAKLLRNAGKLVLGGFVHGLNDVVPQLRNSLHGITGKLNQQVTANVTSGPPVVFGPNMSPRNVMMPITINTQEIRPEYHAAKLGTLIAGRIA